MLAACCWWLADCCCVEYCCYGWCHVYVVRFMRARACVRQHVRACVLFVLSIVVVMIRMVTTMIWWSLPYSLNWITRANPGVLVDLVFVGGNLRRAQGANACPGGRSKCRCVPRGSPKGTNTCPGGGPQGAKTCPGGGPQSANACPGGGPQSANTCPGGGPSECQYVSRQGAFKLPIRSRWRPKSVQFRARLEGLD